MKKMTLIILLILLNIHPSSAKNTCAPEKLNVSCWDCGTNCTADLVNNELIITGTGTVNGVGWNGARWRPVSDQIQKVTINKGITGIGSAAFYSMPILESVDLPNTLLSIGQEAFELTGLKKITLPDSLQTIGHAAFNGSYGLDNVVVPTSVTSVGQYGLNIRGTVYCPEGINCNVTGTTKPYSKVGTYYSMGGKMYRNLENMLKGIYMRRIYTIEEATEAVSGKGKNTFQIRYK